MLTSLTPRSVPMYPRCPRSPRAPRLSPTAGVWGSRTRTARITDSVALTDAPTLVSLPRLPPLRLFRVLHPRSLRSRLSLSRATPRTSAMVSCSRLLTLTRQSLSSLLLLGLLQLRLRAGLLRLHHPSREHLLRVLQRDHGRQMSQNLNLSLRLRALMVAAE